MGTIQIDGSTPKLTIGNATAEDATILFDGNAQDFYIALDDSADDLLIGLGSTVGTTPIIAIDENKLSTFSGAITVGVNDTGHDVKFFGATASAYMLWDESADDLILAGAAGLSVAGATATAALTASGIIKTDDTTEATSTTDGSLQTDGGLSVAKDTVLGDDLKLLSDSSVVAFGADGDTTLTHTDGTGLTLNSTNKLCFNDATQFIQGASGTVLDIAATDEIELTATLLDVNANLDVSGTSLLPTLGVVTAKDLGSGIHVRTADSGGSVSGDADELVLESNGITGMTFLSANDESGRIFFGDDGSAAIGWIRYFHTSNYMDFGANDAQRMRIDSAGRVQINNTEDDANLQVVNSGGATYAAFFRGNSTETVVLIRSNTDAGNNRTVDFIDGDGTLCGSINVNAGGNTVSYETSSDYRLKENVIDLTDAITRVKNLKPYRFNFKAKPDTTLDGFLAHEVQDVVPEAGSGTKDETETKTNVIVNSKGNVEHEGITEEEWTQGKTDEKYAIDTQWFASKEFIRPQGMDSSKLVPLLTSALQEAITKIETLEAKVTALEG